MSASNVVWHQGEVTRALREKVHGQRGVTLWFTGLSGAGKSTVASRVESLLLSEGHFAYRLDGDNVRHGLNGDLGFGEQDRRENIRRVGEVAKLFTDAGTITLCAFISPFRQDREDIRNKMAAGDFVEVFVNTPLEICEERDPKGLYKKARSGEIAHFTGIDQQYEKPEHPEIELRTDTQSLERSAKQVLDFLQERGYVKPS